MKSLPCCVLFLLLWGCCNAAPFSPLMPENHYGVMASNWRFASSLSADATGTIEFVVITANGPERIVGRVEVRPFQSSESKIPDLHVLLTTAVVAGRKQAVLIAGYGIRSGAFVVDDADLTTKSRIVDGTPATDAKGEHALLVFGGDSMNLSSGEGITGRLLLRYRGGR